MHLALLFPLVWSLAGSGETPRFEAELVFPLHDKHNHAPGIVECPNGDLLVSWYRGSGERRSDDVAVFGSRRKKGEADWSDAFLMADRPGFPDCNTTMMIDGRGRLGDKLYQRLGWQPRSKPTVLPSGRILLPLYSDTFSISIMATSDDGGETWYASKPLIGFGNIQPAVLRRDDGTLVAYMREGSGPATWKNTIPVPITIPPSSKAATARSTPSVVNSFPAASA